MFCESSSNGSGSLWSQIKRFVFLVFVKFTELCLLSLVDYSQNSSDSLSNNFTIKILRNKRKGIYILASLEAAPPVT